MKYLIKLSDGYIYPHTETLATQSGMREPTQKEVDDFFGVASVQAKKLVVEAEVDIENRSKMSDNEVKAWAEARKIDNDKNAIAQYSLAKFGKKANKQFNELNMVRELIRLEK